MTSPSYEGTAFRWPPNPDLYLSNNKISGVRARSSDHLGSTLQVQTGEPKPHQPDPLRRAFQLLLLTQLVEGLTFQGLSSLEVLKLKKQHQQAD
ncbi:leucine-rich repeats and immunoglobulin-like domains protein 1 isoform X1 [Lates japonicus]|nr:leucine-rich repeats and immunoglobulin-like domains protein 1 isoform X1 [Lates japonicus]